MTGNGPKQTTALTSCVCPDCGKRRWELGPQSIAGLCACGIAEQPKQYGWVCPVCGRGKAPFLTECRH